MAQGAAPADGAPRELDFSIFVGNSLSLADFAGVTYWWYMLSLVLSLSITGLAGGPRKCAVQLWARWALELGDAADEGHNAHRAGRHRAAVLRVPLLSGRGGPDARAAMRALR